MTSTRAQYHAKAAARGRLDTRRTPAAHANLIDARVVRAELHRMRATNPRTSARRPATRAADARSARSHAAGAGLWS